MSEPADETSTSLYQKRKKIHPRKVSGIYQKLRVFTISITLGWYFLAPWLTWDGRQAILFDLPNRKFYIFGMTFWPQDFILLAWLLIIAALSLLFITTLAGRLWCGYSCPQTVWTKLYMWIERMTEGSRIQRIRLDRSPWTINKVLRRLAKHSFWLLLAFATAMTFVGFFTPVTELFHSLFNLKLGPWESFWIVFFTLATYTNAGWMREQICIYMCPYARFQSSMLDKDTMIITYDAERGESRGSRKRGVDYKSLGLGDCIDCNQCVQVCPTGIDIRKGLQMECIGCAACVDICNQVMDKMQYPKGLIRYSTENALSHNKTRILRPRLIASGVILLIMITAFTYALGVRVPLRLDILRDRHHLYRETTDGDIENGYELKIINKSQQAHTYKIKVSGMSQMKYTGKPEVTIEANQLLTLPVSVQVPYDQVKKTNSKIYFTVTDVENNDVTITNDNRFIGPERN